MTKGRFAGVRILAILMAFWGPNAAAWNDTGHMIAALIAFDQLPPDVRAAAGQLLHAHPRFHEDFEPQLPRNLVKAAVAEQDRWYFAFAATWPDQARRFARVRSAVARDALIARYHHGSWHYINLPIYLRSSDQRQLHQRTPSMRWSPGLDPAKLNIVQALEMFSTTWCDPHQTDAEHALALSWLLHLIGDLQQPLHTTALYSVPEFIHGDRGGNDIAVVGGTNLHALWDGALGDERRHQRLITMARQYGRVEVVDSAVNFQRWAKEGRTLAAAVVYTTDVRNAVATATRAAPPRVSLGRDYRAEMRTTAQARIGLAGHRLAAVIEPLFAREASTRCRR
jgi:hypothetical protein